MCVGRTTEPNNFFFSTYYYTLYCPTEGGHCKRKNTECARVNIVLFFGWLFWFSFARRFRTLCGWWVHTVRCGWKWLIPFIALRPTIKSILQSRLEIGNIFLLCALTFYGHFILFFEGATALLKIVNFFLCHHSSCAHCAHIVAILKYEKKKKFNAKRKKLRRKKKKLDCIGVNTQL